MPLDQTPLPAMRRVADFKFGVESQRRCAGACSGCVLTKDERAQDATFSSEDRDRIADLVARFFEAYEAWQPANAEGEYPTNIEIQYVQGEHLMLPEETLRDYVRLAHRAFGGDGDALMSTSLLVNFEKLQRALDVLADESARLDQPVYMVGVMDPLLLANERMRDIYHRNVKAIEERLDTIDPALNVPPGTDRAVTPSDFDRFIRDLGIRDVELALLPTATSAAAFGMVWRDSVSWFRKIIRLVGKHGAYNINIVDYIAENMDLCAEMTEAEFIDFFTDKLTWGMFIGLDGRIALTQIAGIADLAPLSERFGFRSTSHLDAASRLTPDNWRQRNRRLASEITASYEAHPVCSTCPYKRACAVSGFNHVRHVMRQQPVAEADCPAGIRGLMDDIANTEISGSGCRAFDNRLAAQSAKADAIAPIAAAS